MRVKVEGDPLRVGTSGGGGVSKEEKGHLSPNRSGTC